MGKFKYKKIMDEFYYRVANFVENKPSLIDELKQKELFFKLLDMDEHERKNLIFDWFLFDYKSEKLSKNVLEYFIESANLNEKERAMYGRFRDNVYSIFEIKSLKVGKAMFIYDLINNREYNVIDTTITKEVEKGQAIVARVLPFEDYYILTGGGYAFPRSVSPAIKISLKNMKEIDQKIKLNPRVLAEVFYAKEKEMPKDSEGNFISLCKKAGIKKSDIKSILNKMKESAKNKRDFKDVQQELFRKMDPASNIDIKEFLSAFTELWNKYIPEYQIEERGQTEKMLISLVHHYVRMKVNPDDYTDVKEAERTANDILKEWLNTSLEELDGKTPQEIIMEERKKLGNPKKGIGISITYTRLQPGEDRLVEADKLYYAALELGKERKYEDAIKVFKKHLEIFPDNSIGWLNMGVMYILLIDKKNALRCFEKALDINPEYKMAKNNLKILKNATREEVKLLAEQLQADWVNEEE